MVSADRTPDAPEPRCATCGHAESLHLIEYATHAFVAAAEPVEAQGLRERIEDIVADACIEYANDEYIGSGLPAERAADRILAALQQGADSERLDWLERECDSLVAFTDGFKVWDMAGGMWDAPTLRAAIEAARAAQGQP